MDVTWIYIRIHEPRLQVFIFNIITHRSRCLSQERLVYNRYLVCYLVNDFTITAYADLYCDNQTYRNLIQSTLYIGSVMGLFIMNMLSDTKGRKFSFLLSWGIANIGILCKCYRNKVLLLGAYTKAIWIMAIAQIILGFGGYSTMIIGYAILSDMCKDTMRQKAILSMNGVWYDFLLFKGTGLGIIRLFLQLLQPMVQLWDFGGFNSFSGVIPIRHVFLSLNSYVFTHQEARQSRLPIIAKNRGHLQQTQPITDPVIPPTHLTSPLNDPKTSRIRQKKQHKQVTWLSVVHLQVRQIHEDHLLHCYCGSDYQHVLLWCAVFLRADRNQFWHQYHVDWVYWGLGLLFL